MTEKMRKLRWESHRRRKEDLRIIVYGNLLRRRMKIRCRDAKLTACCRKSGKKQINQLHSTHRMEVKDQIGQRHKTRKSGEKRYHKRSLFAFFSKHTHIGIRKSGSHTADQTDQRRKRYQRRPRRLQDQKTSDKRADDNSDLRQRNFFLQDQYTEKNRKKR